MTKYAIYRAPTGLYSLEYVDDVEGLAGSGFEQFITEDQLPVVFDGRGGYFRFNYGDHRFVRIVVTDGEPLKLEEMFNKNDPDFKLGWISPDGDTYSCSYTNHNKCAKYLAKKFYPNEKLPETALYRAGWLKVIDSWDGKERQHGQFVYSERGKLTNRQINKLFDLGLYENDEVQKMIGDNY